MSAATLSCEGQPGGDFTVTFAGDWLLAGELPSHDEVLARMESAPPSATVSLRADGLGAWDSGLLTSLIAILQDAKSKGIQVDSTNLPEGAQKLLGLAFAVKEREGARRKKKKIGFFQHVGLATLDIVANLRALLTFTGELVLSVGRFLRGKATYLRSDVVVYCQEAGAEALPIVSLIAFLIGMIFAFVGVMQLNTFGAGIYTANLVAVAMVREMSPIMTAIIMAGRTGASYAAQIGTMKVNEEVDALTTLGLDPVDFLVTPRVFALVIMMPLLTMYGSLLGIMGGTLVGVSMLDISMIQFLHQTVASVDLSDLFGGLFKSIVYGALVAMAGCQQGMVCGSSAMAVGQATTRAVVLGIVLIVVSAAVLTVIYINLGI
jgi:phospholipid/cholesterol/gamma-HCH transport system permease protein